MVLLFLGINNVTKKLKNCSAIFGSLVPSFGHSNPKIVAGSSHLDASGQ
jgi:hypothetical protein